MVACPVGLLLSVPLATCHITPRSLQFHRTVLLDRLLLPGQRRERGDRAYRRGPIAGCRQEGVSCGECPSQARPREGRVGEGTGRGIGKMVSWPGRGGPEQNRPQHNQERRAQSAVRLHMVATILCTPAKGITTRPDM